MQQTVFIPRQLPGMNEILQAAAGAGGHKINYARLKAKLCEEIYWTLYQAKLRPATRPVMITFHWREPNRMRDLDNIRAGAKFIMDSLVQAKVIAGDGWAHVHSLSDTFTVDKKTPGVLVELEEV